MSGERAAIGFRAHMGWAAAVGIAVVNGAPQLVHSSIIATAPEGDRIAKEPYHVAAGWDGLARVQPHPNPAAAVAQGRKTQERMASKAVADIVAELKAKKIKVIAGAVLATRGLQSYTLEEALSHHAHVHVAEGMAVREAVRLALKANKILLREFDQKSLYVEGAEALKLTEARLKQRLTELKGTAKPWTQDQKLCALAAWLALAGN
jgi:hypothetical protein